MARANFGLFTDGKHASGNAFREHKTKQKLAAMPTVAMGKRLEEAIGKNKLKRIMNIAHNAGLLQIRESAIYFQREGENLIFPADKIDKDLARTLVLFAIEVFDDSLVGWTDYSFQVSEITTTLFQEISKT